MWSLDERTTQRVAQRALAQRLRSAVRASDVVCRHSGDEFIVLLQDGSAWDEVAAIADRLLKEIERPVQLDHRQTAVSARIGVAIYPDDATDPQTLVRHADTAMYAAKNLGRARVSFFCADFNAQLQATQQLERELRQALVDNEFILHYQPQVDAGSGELLGCEALIRWQHPTRGRVPPLQFIGAAEQCGLISDLGAWTIDRSFVTDLPGDDDDRVPVQAIVQLAKALGIRVVAEGAETDAQRDNLQCIGCSPLQGYLISRPQPAEGFERFARLNAQARLPQLTPV